MASSEDRLLLELESVRRALASARAARGRREVEAALRALPRIQEAVRRPVRIAIMGEGNSGKSLLINYLLKHQVLPSGRFSGDSTQLLIRHAPEPSVHAVHPDGSRNRLTSSAFGRLIKPDMGTPSAHSHVIYDATRSAAPNRHTAMTGMGLAGGKGSAQPTKLIDVGLPLSFLQAVEIIEVRSFPEHQAISAAGRAFRQVDLAIWCTLATQAWKETEVAAFKNIPRPRRKRALMLVTYKDAIRRSADEVKIMARLRQVSAKLFDDVVLLSLRDALQSLLVQDKDSARGLHQQSNVAAAETALAALVEDWQRQRYRKAGRLLYRLAETLRRDESASAGSTVGQYAARLSALSAEFLNASPSVSLSERAA